MKTGAILLIIFLTLFTGCLGGEEGPKPVREFIGTEAAALDLGHAHVLGVSPEGEIFMGLHDGLAVSYDKGKTWRQVKISEEELKDFMAIAIDPVKPNIIYLGGHGHGVWGSDDYGKTWRLLAEGLPPKPDVHALAIDPSNTRVVYALISGDALYKSTNSGATWSIVPIELDTYAITAVAVDSKNPNYLYAGGTGMGVKISEDGGKTWRSAAEGLENPNVIALAMTKKGMLYAGTWGGVFKSNNRGASWTMVKELELEAFGLNVAKPEFMVAGSKKGEIYVSEDEGYQWTLAFKPKEGEGHFHGPAVEAVEEEFILITGPAKNYRPITSGEKGRDIEGNVTDPGNAYDLDYDDVTTFATVRAQGCDSNYAAVYEWEIKESENRPVLYYQWDFTQEVDRASIGAYAYTTNEWKELFAIIDFAPMEKRSLRIPWEYISEKGEVKLYFEVITPCSVGVMQLYDVYLSIPE